MLRGAEAVLMNHPTPFYHISLAFFTTKGAKLFFSRVACMLAAQCKHEKYASSQISTNIFGIKLNQKLNWF